MNLRTIGLTITAVALVGVVSVLSQLRTPEQAAATQTAFAVTARSIMSTAIQPTNTEPPPTETTMPTETDLLKALPAVQSVESVARDGKDYWARVTVWPKMNKESFAQLILIQALKGGYVARAAVWIDDGSSAAWWIYDEKAEWSKADQAPAWVDQPSTATARPALGGSQSSSAPIPQSTSAATEAAFECPANCTEAKARGVSAVQAAGCGLDRDGDGVACYGD